MTNVMTVKVIGKMCSGIFVFRPTRASIGFLVTAKQINIAFGETTIEHVVKENTTHELEY